MIKKIKEKINLVIEFYKFFGIYESLMWLKEFWKARNLPDCRAHYEEDNYPTVPCLRPFRVKICNRPYYTCNTSG